MFYVTICYIKHFEEDIMSEKIDNLLVLARRAKSNSDTASAARYYEQIMIEDPNNWEAAFYYDYCNAASCVIRDISPAANRIGKAFQNLTNIVTMLDLPDKETVLLQCAADAVSLLAVLRNSAYNHYMKHSSANGASAEYKDRLLACGNAALVIGDCFYRLGDKKSAADMYKQAEGLFNGKYALNETAVNRIKEIYPEFAPKAAGCYVATAVYGSYDCPQVWTLRRFRDNTLASTWYGRAFIRTYYAISPTLVKWFGHTAWFKNMWRGKLDKMVNSLQKQGVESTPYQDKNW
jgi:tetratricopeptide (TPR) repeat protein